MSLEQIISNYGYLAVGIGTFLEGETILVLAGFSSHRGFLDFPLVILSAFLGTLFGDQLYFYIGRIKGESLLEKRPAWRVKSNKVLPMLVKHQTLLIIGFRFLYGLRTVTPFILGASKVNPVRFFILNVVGAFVWAVAIGSGGYLFGTTLELIISDVKKYEMLILGGILLTGLIIWSFNFVRRKR